MPIRISLARQAVMGENGRDPLIGSRSWPDDHIASTLNRSLERG